MEAEFASFIPETLGGAMNFVPLYRFDQTLHMLFVPSPLTAYAKPDKPRHTQYSYMYSIEYCI